MLKFEGVGYDVGGHQKIHKGHNKHQGQKYFIFYIFFKIAIIEKYGKKDIGENWKIAFEATSNAKKDIMGAKYFNILYANEN